MACARRLLLLLYLLPVSLAWRPKTVFHLHKVSTTPPSGGGPHSGSRGFPAPLCRCLPPRILSGLPGKEGPRAFGPPGQLTLAPPGRRVPDDDGHRPGSQAGSAVPGARWGHSVFSTFCFALENRLVFHKKLFCR